MSAPEMIAKLMSARTAAHMAHLKTNSFAAHKALEGFYDEIVDLVDSFAETYQGIFGLIKDYPDVGLPAGNPVEWINGLRQWLKKDREASCKGESPLQNIHDEIMGLCAHTVYKLKYLDNPAMCGPEMESTEEEANEKPDSGNDTAGYDKYMKMSKWA